MEAPAGPSDTAGDAPAMDEEPAPVGRRQKKRAAPDGENKAEEQTPAVKSVLDSLAAGEDPQAVTQGSVITENVSLRQRSNSAKTEQRRDTRNLCRIRCWPNKRGTGSGSDSKDTGDSNYSPFEVEEVLRRHPAVVDLLAFPIVHYNLGQAVAVLVVFTVSEASLPELSGFGLRALASHQLPVAIVVTGSIPAKFMGAPDRASLSVHLALPEWPCEQTMWDVGELGANVPIAVPRPASTRFESAQSVMQTVGDLARMSMRTTNVPSPDVPLMDAGMDSITILLFVEVRTILLRCASRLCSIVHLMRSRPPERAFHTGQSHSRANTCLAVSCINRLLLRVSSAEARCRGGHEAASDAALRAQHYPSASTTLVWRTARGHTGSGAGISNHCSRGCPRDGAHSRPAALEHSRGRGARAAGSERRRGK